MLHHIAQISRKFSYFLALAALLVLPLPAVVEAAATAPTMAAPTGLVFTQIKITGDEFIMLKNNTAAAISDLSQYWLEDFNNVSPLATGASNSSQQLPAVQLDAGQSLLLSGATRDTCSAEVAGKLSISLTDAGGFLELVQMTQNQAGAVTQLPGDVVSWSSTTTGQIQSVPSSTKDPQGAYYRYATTATTYGWQAADVSTTNACQLTVTTGSGSTATTQPISGGSLISAADSAPVTIISVNDDDESAVTAATLPAADIGLTAPEVTELLPNPSGTGNDGTDEFIELYNPNDSNFDVSGFVLQAGTTALHNYTFPAGSGLSPKSFTAFYSSQTAISLSNSGGQVRLLDPLANVISQSDVYAAAADGAGWALANGKWYWTTTLTPGAANVIKQPTATTKTSKAKAKSTAAKAKSSSAKTSKASGQSSASLTDSKSATTNNLTAPIHPWILALVACLALLYAAYEYRADLANYSYRFRRYLATRRINR